MLDEKTFLEVFEGVPQAELSGDVLDEETYRQMQDEYLGDFDVSYGGEVIADRLKNLDLAGLKEQLREELKPRIEYDEQGREVRRKKPSLAQQRKNSKRLVEYFVAL